MMVHRFWTKNDPIALNETFFRENYQHNFDVPLTFIYVRSFSDLVKVYAKELNTFSI